MSGIEKGVFVTGTDTGVGKTIVSASIALNLHRLGKRVAVMKPVQTGTIVSGPTDIRICPERFSVRRRFIIGYCSCPYSFP